ncbi:MAG: hypothetical protein KAJ51_06915, partial [Thermoplasmata archaeon]|nr:hypothetical protein [Thermoplasmata archaeon]
RIGTDPEFRNGLEITLSFEGVKLNWKPAMNLNKFEKADHYNIYRSNLRHGFNFSNLIHSTPWTSPELTSFMDTSIIDQVGAYYYLVAPVSPIGRVGSSTFSVGVVIRTYSRGYSGFALPLRLTTNVSVVHFEGSYNYSDEDLGKIDYLAFIDTIYYYNNSMQKWIGVPRLLPAELKHLQIVNYDGYLIYLAIKNVKLCFIGR